MDAQAVKRHGFRFLIIKRDNHTIAIMRGIKLGGVKVKGIAKCNTELDEQDETYGEDLAMRRAVSKYYRKLSKGMQSQIDNIKKILKEDEERKFTFDAHLRNTDELIKHQLDHNEFEKGK